MYPNTSPFPLNINQNVNIDGGLAIATPATERDQVPQMGQVDDAVAVIGTKFALLDTAIVDIKKSILKKLSCKVAATSNHVVGSQVSTINGIAVSDGTRVFLGFQNNPFENGTYKRANGSLSRNPILGGSDDAFATSALVKIEQGTYGGKTFVLTTTGAIEVGSTAMSWELVAPEIAPPRKFVTYIGNDVDTEISVGHGLNTSDVVCALYEVATGASVVPVIISRTNEEIVLSFASAPSEEQYAVTVIG